MVVVLNDRAISTVASVEPSLTTITSSIEGCLARTPRTSAIVFSSLYAAMIAETPKLFSLNPFSTGAGCNRQTIPYEDPRPAPRARQHSALFLHRRLHYETHSFLRVVANRPLPGSGRARCVACRMQFTRKCEHREPDILTPRDPAACQSRYAPVNGLRLHGRRR